MSLEEQSLEEAALREVKGKEPDSSQTPREAFRALREGTTKDFDLVGEICSDRRNQIIGCMLCTAVEPLKDLGAQVTSVAT